VSVEAFSPVERPTTPRSVDDLPEQHAPRATTQPDPRRRYSWPADARHANVIRDAVHRWLGTLPMSMHDVVSMVVAVDAAVENVIRHAYLDRAEGTGTVEIACWTEDGQACAEVIDHGTWRAPRERVVSRGIPLMERLIGSVSVQTCEQGTRVLLRHPISTSQGTATDQVRSSAG
jgi:anti-sigma regulatory factor (Ser/Thr protein kinase)